MNEPTQAVAKRPAGQMTLKDHLNSPSFAQQIQRALPTGQGGQRLIRAALTSMQKNPKLAEADQNSFFAGLLTLAQMGLVPDGREAHLVPVWNSKANRQDILAIPDFKGLIKLILEAGQVSYLHADVVCDNDVFEENRGRVVTHKIDRRNVRGPVYAVYALAVFKDGTEKAEVMGIEEVEAIRSRSRAKDSGPWVTDYNEMAKKTVLKRLSKWLNLSPAAADAIEADVVADVDETVTTTVSAPPMPEVRPRQALPEAPKRRGRPPSVKPADPVDDVPMDTPTPPPQTPPAEAKPKKPTNEAVTAWMQSKGLEFDEIVQALIDYGIAPETCVRRTVQDLLPAEVAFLEKDGDAVAQAIIDGRG